MKLGCRFALNLLAPAPLAALLLIVTSGVFEKGGFITTLHWLPIYILVGYLYAIVPSFAHACWLHRRYRGGLDPCSRGAVGHSTLGGTAAGLTITLFFATVANGTDTGVLLLFIPLGATTGALNGLLQFLIRDHPRGEK